MTTLFNNECGALICHEASRLIGLRWPRCRRSQGDSATEEVSATAGSLGRPVETAGCPTSFNSALQESASVKRPMQVSIRTASRDFGGSMAVLRCFQPAAVLPASRSQSNSDAFIRVRWWSSAIRTALG